MALPEKAAKPTGAQLKKSSKQKSDETMLIVIILLIIIAALTTAVVVTILMQNTQKSKCPSSCDDANPCTDDYCDDEKGKCVNMPLDGDFGLCSGSVETCKLRTCDFGSCVEVFENDCCGNGECEEGETYFDCSDDCLIPEFEINCTDGLDDDLDDLIDCMDLDCNCTENCTDGIDNDWDGFIDCTDTDCNCTEICDSGEDEDGDGLVDCCDLDDCKNNPHCIEDCDDGKDNDCDNKADCDDSDCAEDFVCLECDDLIDKKTMIAWFRNEFGIPMIKQWENDCEDIPGEFRGKVSEVGCLSHNVSYFDCDTIENSSFFEEIIEFCKEEMKATWVCKSYYIGCLCNKKPPKKPEEENECENAPVDDPGDWFDCTEYNCPNGDECYWNWEARGCGCQDPDACGWHLEEPDNPNSESCYGGCPDGEYCDLVEDVDHWNCECVSLYI